MANELEEYINSYFGIVETDELQKITSLFKVETIKKDDYFLRTGKRSDELSFIQSGYLRIFANTDKKEITQWISTKGYFVADLHSFVFNSPARWTIQALSDVVIYSINRDDYNKIVDFVPKWQELERMFIVKCFTMIEDRVFSHISMTAEERYSLFFESNKELFNNVPLQYIASMLVMTHETLSRIRKKQLL